MSAAALVEVTIGPRTYRVRPALAVAWDQALERGARAAVVEDLGTVRTALLVSMRAVFERAHGAASRDEREVLAVIAATIPADSGRSVAAVEAVMVRR